MPRLRTCGSPIPPASVASAGNGFLERRIGRAHRACVVPAFTVTFAPEARRPEFFKPAEIDDVGRAMQAPASSSACSVMPPDMNLPSSRFLDSFDRIGRFRRAVIVEVFHDPVSLPAYSAAFFMALHRIPYAVRRCRHRHVPDRRAHRSRHSSPPPARQSRRLRRSPSCPTDWTGIWSR